MPTSYYLPEYHDFDYIAVAPWPQPQVQMDWIQGYLTMEQWLNQYVGGHYTRWAWATQRDHNSWEACVAFRWEKHRTLFLLTWA